MRQHIWLIVVFLNLAPATFAGPPHIKGQPREGWDVLYANPPIKVEGCHLSAGNDQVFRPGYVTNCDYTLQTKDGKDCLCIYVTRSENAYLELKPHPPLNEEYPGWIPLSFEKFKSYWGPGHLRVTKTGHYYTFDALSKPEDQEVNLYHIDLQLDDKGNAIAYRIRGIGINNSDWVFESTKL